MLDGVRSVAICLPFHEQNINDDDMVFYIPFYII